MKSYSTLYRRLWLAMARFAAKHRNQPVRQSEDTIIRQIVSMTCAWADWWSEYARSFYTITKEM